MPIAQTTTDAAPLELAALEAGVRALGLALTDGQIESLQRFAGLLARWGRAYNLTAIRAGDQVLSHHLLDSLSLVLPLREVASQLPRRPGRVLDVGSGGGLPGIPLAIACPDLAITLVDTVQKKVAFLVQAALELRLQRVTALHARVQDLHGEFDLITSRAFASLADFVAWTQHLLAPDGRWLAMKGRIDPAEVAALPPGVTVKSIRRLDVPGLNEERHLVEIARS